MRNLCINRLDCNKRFQRIFIIRALKMTLLNLKFCFFQNSANIWMFNSNCWLLLRANKWRTGLPLGLTRNTFWAFIIVQYERCRPLIFFLSTKPFIFIRSITMDTRITLIWLTKFWKWFNAIQHSTWFIHNLTKNYWDQIIPHFSYHV